MTLTAPWVGFVLLVIGLLALDLGVFHRRPHAIRAREALLWTGFWIVLSMAFSGVVYAAYEHGWHGLGVASDLGGREAVAQFITGYVVEKSLSLEARGRAHGAPSPPAATLRRGVRGRR